MKLPIMPLSLRLCLMGYAWFGRDAPHTRATRLLVMAIIATGCGHSPFKALFAPLVATVYTLLGTVSSDVRRCLLVTAQCDLPASLCKAKYGRFIAVGVLGGDATRLLKHAFEEVVMSALSWALRSAFR
jgi:hypothetical protein